MKKSYIFIISAFLYVFVMGLFFNKVSVIASELEEEAFEVIDQEDGFISFDEEDQQDSEPILQDIIEPIKSTKGSRSVLTNTYDSSVSWLFDQTYFVDNVYVQNTNFIGYIFPDNYFGDKQDILLNDFLNNYFIPNYGSASIRHQNYGGGCSIISKISSSYLSYYNQNIMSSGFPSQNTYWEEPEITPDPTPTVDPTPTPDPEGGQVVINKDFENIIVFCFGIIAGIMIGKLLLGFVK